MRACPTCGVEATTEAKFCMGCGSPLSGPIQCPSCGYANEENSKFCQECGSKLGASGKLSSEPRRARVKAASTIVEEEIPPPAMTGAVLEFGYSTSARFEMAAAEALRLPTCEKFRDGKKVVYRIALPTSEAMEAVTELRKLLSGWKSVRYFLDGKPVLSEALFRHDWCYQNRKAAYQPDRYCFGLSDPYDRFNVWGCKMLGFPFFDDDDLWTWGEFVDRTGLFRFNKQRLRAEIARRLFEYRFCPALNLQLAEGVFDGLPESVNPKRDMGWRFIEAFEPRPGALEIVRNLGEGFEERRWAVGVRPSGIEALEPILRHVGVKRIPMPSPPPNER